MVACSNSSKAEQAAFGRSDHDPARGELLEHLVLDTIDRRIVGLGVDEDDACLVLLRELDRPIERTVTALGEKK